MRVSLGFGGGFFRVSLGLMMMMMMWMCKRLAQVPMLCVLMYNIKLAMMPKTPMFTAFSAHTKMTAEKRGQDEVFARNFTFPPVLIIPLHISS